MRPVIVVTGADQGSFSAWAFTAFGIWFAGGKPRRSRPSKPFPLSKADAFVLGGGADVDPGRYGEKLPEMLKKEPAVKRSFLRSLTAIVLFLLRRIGSTSHRRGPDTRRDELEIGCLEEAARRNLPVLGICRGAQIMNVYLGGSLFQSIKDFYTESPQIKTVLPRKLVAISPGTRLFRVLGRAWCEVNSLHNQSVKHLGAGLSVAAKEPNGVVQAIEREGEVFWLGVQWHPEYLFYRPEQRALFRTLVREAARLPEKKARRAHPTSSEWARLVY